VELFLMYYDLFDHDISTSRTHFVNFGAYTVSINDLESRLEIIWSRWFWTNRKRVGLCDFLLVVNSNLGPILSRFTHIRAFVRRKPLFRYPSPIPVKISGCSPWNKSVMLGSAKSEYPSLTVIFEVYQPMWSRCLDVTDGRTDRRLAVAIPRSA